MIVPDRFNLADWFLDRHVREGRAGKVAVRCEGRSFTYGEIAEQVNRLGNDLIAAGVRPGDRVLMLLADSPAFVIAWFAIIKIGAIAVPTSTALRPADYAYCVEVSEARAVIADPALAAIVPHPNVLAAGEWDARLAALSTELDAAPAHKDDPAFWLWTSGSTGAPKAAVHRHRDWICCCEGYATGILGVRESDVTFSASKLFHAYGLGNGLMFPFHAGATTVFYPGRPQARVILETAARERPTLFFSVPTLYAAMLQETDAGNPYDLSSVRFGVSAAETLPAGICRQWPLRFGFELLDGIGSTEALHIYASARPGEVRPGSTGKMVPGYELRITEDGDLLVRGESVAAGYHNRPDLTTGRFRDGWFSTGDKFRMDADGYLWYSGRSDDMFRVSGEWVSPSEVETALIDHPAVLEAAVVPFREDSGILRPKAYVVRKGEVTVEELQHFVKSRIAPYKYPRRIEFVEDLPKTATGKIQRYKLREQQETSA